MGNTRWFESMHWGTELVLVCVEGGYWRWVLQEAKSEPKSAESVINEVCSRDWEGSRVPRESVREENIHMKVEEVRVKERACRPLWPQTEGNPLKSSRSFYSQHFWPQRRCFPSNTTSSTVWHQRDVQPFSSTWTLPGISTSSHRVKDFVPQCVSHHRHQLQVWAPLPSDWPATNGGFP